MRFGRVTKNTSKSRPMMNLTARMPSVVSSSTSSNPGRTSYGYQDLGKSVASDDRSGKLEKPSPPGYSKEDYGQSWSSQEWKSWVAAPDRSGKPEGNSWDSLQKVDPHREEHLLGGNAHSARYEETIHDRSVKPDKTSWDAMQQVRPHHEEPLLDGNAKSARYGDIIHNGSGLLDNVNYQEEAESETFVMGSDEAEFVNKVKDQVRRRRKRMSNVADSEEEHSIIW